jgi:hypothetical protein
MAQARSIDLFSQPSSRRRSSGSPISDGQESEVFSVFISLHDGRFDQKPGYSTYDFDAALCLSGKPKTETITSIHDINAKHGKVVYPPLRW